MLSSKSCPRNDLIIINDIKVLSYWVIAQEHKTICFLNKKFSVMINLKKENYKHSNRAYGGVLSSPEVGREQQVEGFHKDI